MSKTPVIIQNTGAWYSQELARILVAANKVADASQAAIKAARIQAKKEILVALMKEFGDVAGAFYESYSRTDEIDADWYAQAKGLKFSVDLDKRQESAAGKILVAFRKSASVSDELCSERCRLRNENSTSDINRFKARLRALFGKSPTEAQCRTVFNDMVNPPKETHVCPLRIRAA